MSWPSPLLPTEVATRTCEVCEKKRQVIYVYDDEGFHRLCVRCAMRDGAPLYSTRGG